jgi:hypothetical protein
MGLKTWASVIVLPTTNVNLPSTCFHRHSLHHVVNIIQFEHIVSKQYLQSTYLTRTKTMNAGFLWGTILYCTWCNILMIFEALQNLFLVDSERELLGSLPEIYISDVNCGSNVVFILCIELYIRFCLLSNSDFEVFACVKQSFSL